MGQKKNQPVYVLAKPGKGRGPRKSKSLKIVNLSRDEVIELLAKADAQKGGVA